MPQQHSHSISIESSVWYDFTDHISQECKAVGSVRLSVHPSVPLFSLFIFWTDWSLNLSFCICLGYDHSLPGIEIQGQMSNV